jgi:hypothetical protein
MKIPEDRTLQNHRCVRTSDPTRTFNIFEIFLEFLYVGILHYLLGYGLYDRGIGVQVPAEVRVLFLHHSVQTACGIPSSLQFSGYRGIVSAGLKRPGSEADLSLLSSADFKNSTAIHPLLHTFAWRGA